MPNQILPDNPTALANDALTFLTDDEIQKLLPAYIRQSDDAPIRDALTAALRIMAGAYQDVVSYAAQQSDIIYATDTFLESKGNEKGIPKHANEDIEAYRTRILGLQACVTPEAICAAVDAIIAPLTCSYIEPDLDQFFAGPDTDDANWACFVDVSPQYFDRLYADGYIWAAQFGLSKPHTSNLPPAGYYDNQDGRFFVLFVPDLAGLDNSINIQYNGTKLDPSNPAVPELGGVNFPVTQYDGEGASAAYGGVGIFPMSPGLTHPENRQFLFSAVNSTNDTYAKIVDIVERLKAGGFRWMMLPQS